MMIKMKFLTNFKKSAKPKNQRKYRFNAPLHKRNNMMKSHLSKELSKKFSKRTARVIKGDKVKIMKGQFKGKSGKIEEVNMKDYKVFIAGIETQKTEGTKVRIPIAVSNIMITELNLSDKKRQEILKRK